MVHLYLMAAILSVRYTCNMVVAIYNVLFAHDAEASMVQWTNSISSCCHVVAKILFMMNMFC